MAAPAGGHRVRQTAGHQAVLILSYTYASSNARIEDEVSVVGGVRLLVRVPLGNLLGGPIPDAPQVVGNFLGDFVAVLVVFVLLLQEGGHAHETDCLPGERLRGQA